MCVRKPKEIIGIIKENPLKIEKKDGCNVYKMCALVSKRCTHDDDKKDENDPDEKERAEVMSRR